MDKTRQIGENENEQGKQIYRSAIRCSRLKKEKKIASQCLLYYRTCASTMKAYTTLVLSLFCCCMYLTEEQKQQWLSMGRSPAYRRIDTLAPNNLSDNPNSLIQLKIRPCLFFSLARRSASSLTNGKMHLVSLLVRIQRRPVRLEVRPNTFRIL